MATAQEKFGAIATLVAQNLNDIPDLPQYKTPPAGVYEFLINSIRQKDIADKTALVVEYQILKTVELDDPESWEEADLVKEGDKFSEAFWFNDPDKVDTTLGVLKLKFGSFGEAFGTENLLEILDKLDGVAVRGKIGNRVDKEDKSKLYPQTKDMVLL